MIKSNIFLNKVYLGFLGVFWFLKLFGAINGVKTIYKLYFSSSEWLYWLRVPGYKEVIYIRLKISDIQTFSQVFCHKEYDIKLATNNSKYMIDAWANVWYAAIWFSNIYILIWKLYALSQKKAIMIS